MRVRMPNERASERAAHNNIAAGGRAGTHPFWALVRPWCAQTGERTLLLCLEPPSQSAARQARKRRMAADAATLTLQQLQPRNASPNSTNDTEAWNELFYRHSPGMTALYCVAYLAVFAVGLVGNCFVVAVVMRSPRMRTVTNYFIVNLALADILVIVFCLPATLMSNIFVPWVLGWWMCKTVPYIQGVSVAASVYSLIAVSLDRFLAIWYPLKCQITKRRARLMIMVIWLVALTTTIPWALFFDLVTVFKEQPDVQICLEVWPPGLDGDLYFLLANLLLCYVVPTILISICYILIWIRVSRRSIPTDTKDGQVERMQQRSKFKVVKMLVAVVVLFVLSWLPLYVIFARIKLGGDITGWEEDVSYILINLTDLRKYYAYSSGR
ncbi:Hypothetical predicted protein [Cloeon dipterum]|uniref:G-protein coupled receptors family 1 profile domain-containing protein n=1 Tax=Cloeon dipterum TaxID=197152 RepID=A0A8S1C8C5_9INSE|nr:Hypothetical predicted protein [Cloeon dipterum]